MENKMFELMEKMYVEMQSMRTELTGEIQGVRSELTSEIQGVRSELTLEIQGIKGEVQAINSRLDNVEKTVLNIENDHGKKLEALFDRYKQNSDQLERIEKKVSSQEEIIIKRIK